MPRAGVLTLLVCELLLKWSTQNDYGRTRQTCDLPTLSLRPTSRDNLKGLTKQELLDAAAGVRVSARHTGKWFGLNYRYGWQGRFLIFFIKNKKVYGQGSKQDNTVWKKSETGASKIWRTQKYKAASRAHRENSKWANKEEQMDV